MVNSLLGSHALSTRQQLKRLLFFGTVSIASRSSSCLENASYLRVLVFAPLKLLTPLLCSSFILGPRTSVREIKNVRFLARLTAALHGDFTYVVLSNQRACTYLLELKGTQFVPLTILPRQPRYWNGDIMNYTLLKSLSRGPMVNKQSRSFLRTICTNIWHTASANAMRKFRYSACVQQDHHWAKLYTLNSVGYWMTVAGSKTRVGHQFVNRAIRIGGGGAAGKINRVASKWF